MVFHHGRLQVLPPTWKLPIITCRQIIDNWYVGNKREKISQLGLLGALHVSHLRTSGNYNDGKVKMRHMRCVIASLEKYTYKENCYLSNKDLWTSEYTKRMWENIGEKHLISKFGGKNRNAEMSWKTLYNIMIISKVLIQGYIEANPHF